MKKVDFKMKFVVGSAAIQDTDKKAKGENNDCFVRAVMNACQVSYDEAHELVATQFGRQRGKGTKGAPLKLKTMATAGEKLAGKEILPLGTFSTTPITPAKAKERGVLLNLKYPKGWWHLLRIHRRQVPSPASKRILYPNSGKACPSNP